VALAGVGALVTWFALESAEVAVLHARGADGGIERTRVWVAEAGGFLWIEAATPERGWYRALLHDPRVDLERSGRVEPHLARPMPGPEAHARIRTLLREKYGWADAWVGLLQDTSRSVAVRLKPMTAEP
jgi:hypothetical protein